MAYKEDVWFGTLHRSDQCISILVWSRQADVILEPATALG